MLDLRLREFEFTGRGVCSTKNVKENDKLITIPFSLMISYCTVHHSCLITPENKQMLTIQDYLSLFLALERNKSDASHWKWYIDTLPADVPALPWLCSEKYLNLLPFEAYDVQEKVTKQAKLYKDSWQRVSDFFRVNESDYCWAYCMVNTRSVHVDPNIVKELVKNNCFCKDEPNMALCPYLDMFNHSDEAMTSAGLKKSGNFYTFELVTHKSYKAHEQIFISYGQRDNLTLLCDYGFYTNSIYNESVEFHVIEILQAVHSNSSNEQCNFIKKHNFDVELKVLYEGLSLKALLYVLFFKEEEDNWASVVFTESYSKTVLFKMYSLVLQKLLEKHSLYVNQHEYVVKTFDGKCKKFRVLIDYFESRCGFGLYFVELCRNKIKENSYLCVLITFMSFNKCV